MSAVEKIIIIEYLTILGYRLKVKFVYKNTNPSDFEVLQLAPPADKNLHDFCRD